MLRSRAEWLGWLRRHVADDTNAERSLESFDYSRAVQMRNAFPTLQANWERLLDLLSQETGDATYGRVVRTERGATYEILGCSFPLKCRVVRATGVASLLEWGIYEREKDEDRPIKVWYLGADLTIFSVAGAFRELNIGSVGNGLDPQNVLQGLMSAVFAHKVFGPIHPAPTK